LDLIRVYTKPKGKDPDYSAPVILPRKFSRIEDFCNKIHRNMIKDFRYAMVWGSSVKFNPQKVGKDHQLEDEDVVQIIKKIWETKNEFYSSINDFVCRYLSFLIFLLPISSINFYNLHKTKNFSAVMKSCKEQSQKI